MSSHQDTDSYRRFASGYLLDAQTVQWFFAQTLRDVEDRLDWRFAHLRAGSAGVAPAWIAGARYDPLIDEDARMPSGFARHVAVRFVQYDGMIHSFFQHAGFVQAARRAHDDACAALREAFGQPEQGDDMNGLSTADAQAIELRTGDWATLGAAAGALRTAVFVREQGIPAEFEWDEWDARSVHCVAYRGDEPVGTGRLLPDGRIGRMAVRADLRGQGIGRRVLEALVAVASARGDTRIELSAQRQVEPFYRAQGFVPVGEPYDEVGIAHVKMRRSLIALGASACVGLLAGLGARPARAGALDAVSNADATSALRVALERGAGQAVARLGKPGGFLDDPKVRIPLPDGLRQAEGLLRTMGRARTRRTGHGDEPRRRAGGAAGKQLLVAP